MSSASSSLHQLRLSCRLCPSLKALSKCTPERRHRSRADTRSYTEADWNEDSVKTVEKDGVDAPASEKYRASKTLAERAFWDFIEKEKPKWDGATINPPFVLGEVLQQVNSPDQLNTSVATFYKWATGQFTERDLPSTLGNWINVKNGASHSCALVEPV